MLGAAVQVAWLRGRRASKCTAGASGVLAWHERSSELIRSPEGRENMGQEDVSAKSVAECGGFDARMPDLQSNPNTSLALMASSNTPET